MEEPEKEKPENPGTAETPAAAENAEQAKPPTEPKKGRVYMETVVDGKTESHDVRFHMPTLLQEVQKLPDGATVRVIAENPDATNQVLLDAVKADAVKAIEASIVKPEDIVKHFQHLVQFLADHSTLQAVGIEAVHLDAEGKDTGFGFVVTAQTCTTAQAVALVNCGDANMAEFVLKTHIAVPGRAAPQMGQIITPTPDQVKQLGK